MKSIGIDIGTTSICGVVIDCESGAVLDSKTISSEAFIPTANSWEKIQSTEKIMSIAKGILDSFLDCGKEDILSIGVTGQMHGIVYIDIDGKAVSPLYTWQDGRGNLPYKDTTYAGHLDSFSGYGNVTDFYNRENGLVPKNAVSYCTIHDYFAMSICENKKPIMHSSDAASFGLYDFENLSFNYDCSIEVTEDFLVIGKYCGIPVSVAIGDNQASVFATLADTDSLLVNIGTGSQISIVSDKPIYAAGTECRPYVGGKYLIVGASLCGGRAYSLLADFYKGVLRAAGACEDNIYGVMARMLEGKTDTTLIVDTRFDGTRSHTEIRGAITGISTSNLTPQDLTLGVLRGIISELHEMYLSMGQKRVGIVGSGNGIRKNPALVKAAEDIFGGKLSIPVYTEEAACGAALFSLIACGHKSLCDVKALIKYKEI